MGILVSVYRDADLRGDCTNGGESSRFNRFTVTNVSGPFEPKDDAPAAQIVPHRTSKGHCFLVPQTVLDSGRWHMFGGNLAYTSDSRFHDKVRELTGNAGSFAISIHDRVEG